MTASTLPAVKASIEGAYSNQSNLTSTPASLNHPFWMPISKAVQPGQSEKAIRNGALAGGGGGAAGAAAGAAGAGAGSLLQAVNNPVPSPVPKRAAVSHGRMFMSAA